jgi:hypothetical protein
MSRTSIYNKNLSGTKSFNDGLGSLIQNGTVETNEVELNGNLILTGSITNGSNSITFDEETTNILKDIHIYGVGYIDYSGLSYNIGELLAQYSAGSGLQPYPSISYDGDTLTTSVIYNLNLASATSILFPSTQTFSSIKLTDNFILNDNTSLSQIQLSLIPNISTLNTKTTNISFAGTTTSFIGSLSFPNNSISSASISNTTRFIENTGNQSIGGQKTFNSILIVNNNIRMDSGSLILNNNTLTIPNTTLQKLQFCSTISSDIQNQTTNNTNNITTNTNNITTNTNNITTNTNDITTNTNSINTLNTKTTDISYSASNTIITNTTNVSNLLISTNINGFSKGDFNNVITQCSSLTSNCQNQINDAISKANSAQNKADTAKTNADNAQGTANTALALAGTANGAAIAAAGIATGAASVAAGAASGVTALETQVDLIETDVTELQVKCTQLSYNPLTSRTTISQTFNSPFLEIGNLTSGFTQTATDQITIAGLLRCNGRVEINNTLELVNGNNIILEGILNQDDALAGTNKFEAPVTMNGNVIMTNTTTTINATTTQIGTNALSTLNCNSTAEFGGDITMLTNKNLRLKNIVPILLDSIYFGGEAGVHLNDDVVFNMKIEANRPLQINNTCQIGTTINRNTLNSYTTTTVLDANTGFTITTPTIGITAPLVSIGQADATSITLNSSGVYIGRLLGNNYLYGTTYIQNLYSPTGIISTSSATWQF